MDEKEVPLSVGCGICISVFAQDEQDFIITTCGHLYHENCLIKWFESSQQLKGAKTCPECRTIIRNKFDIRPAFLCFPAPDETQLELSKREQDSKEKDQIIAELLLEKSRLKKKINLDALRIERLTSQKEKLEQTLQKPANATRIRSVHTRSMMSNATNKNKTIDASSDRTVTKKLRNREYQYTV